MHGLDFKAHPQWCIPPVRPRLPSLPKLWHPLGTKYSNSRVYEEHLREASEKTKVDLVKYSPSQPMIKRDLKSWLLHNLPLNCCSRGIFYYFPFFHTDGRTQGQMATSLFCLLQPLWPLGRATWPTSPWWMRRHFLHGTGNSSVSLRRTHSFPS